MSARMPNPIHVIPGALDAMLAFAGTLRSAEVPARTLGLVHLRASQVNGCSLCVDMHPRLMKREGETDQRILALAAWRDAPYFTPAERAALALTEAVTRIADREDPVPDAVWAEAARHYSEPQLAGLVLAIAQINVFNRVNVATRQPAGSGPT